MDLEHDIRFIRLREVLLVTSIPKSTLMAKISDGDFPVPVDIGTRSRAWVESEVKLWMKEKIEDRDKKILDEKKKYE